MIELIDTRSPRALALKIVGKIERSDIEALRQAIDQKLEKADKLGIYVEVESFGGISLDALAEDLRLVLPYFNKFDKKAVVSGGDWLDNIAEIANKVVPGIEVRHFKPEQKEEALEWVKEEK